MISDEDLEVIAREHVVNWEKLYLGLSLAQKEEIRRSEEYGDQKQECLEVWKEVKGKEATYRALVTAAEEARDQRLADNVKDMLK